MVENCWGGSGYSAETPGRLGFKGLRLVLVSDNTFDEVDHDTLVEHLLRTYGIGSVVPGLLRSYLCSCLQTVLFDGILSSIRSLICEFPQGQTVAVSSPVISISCRLRTILYVRTSTSDGK